ncbi:transcription antitermination factor NusB [Candidatus Marinimicrobia bacterium]|mgnify:FL=1|jgi:N utilization substance protein B|nr:transcription antitermination factor NusB [Candidatus Neomarinimicrobiota bacterium]MDA8753499.1 transcription antitermination factor NusB [Candidatus Neomarinimicrobiota bacterium]MDC0384000.1 transcription antitermination factor NusB [Candidatus Neomarinimicrobiota bacterium]
MKIHARRMAREGVLEALFSHQFSDVERKVTVNRVLKNVPERKVNLEFITALFNNVLDNSKWADELIEEHLQNWEFDRVAKVDKVLLKMGICEIYFLEDIPPKVTISEMVEISKVYSTDESPNFINGILDAVYKDFQKKGKN